MTLYDHFREDERDIVDYLTDLKRQVLENYYPKLSRFLTPREIIIATSILGKSDDIKFDNYGGHPHAERTRLLIYPSYHQLNYEDFEIVLFQVTYAEKFNEIHHRQVLGSLMSLGIKREMIGDILINDKSVQFFVTEVMATYIEQHLMKIGKAKVRLTRVPFKDALVPIEDWEEQSLTVSALRLDVVVAGVLNLSRKISQSLVNKERVKLNHAICADTSKPLAEGDLISIQGYGRFKLNLIGSRTRKDKIRIEVLKLLKK